MTVEYTGSKPPLENFDQTSAHMRMLEQGYLWESPSSVVSHRLESEEKPVPFDTPSSLATAIERYLIETNGTKPIVLPHSNIKISPQLLREFRDYFESPAATARKEKIEKKPTITSPPLVFILAGKLIRQVPQIEGGRMARENANLLMNYLAGEKKEEQAVQINGNEEKKLLNPEKLSKAMSKVYEAALTEDTTLESLDNIFSVAQSGILIPIEHNSEDSGSNEFGLAGNLLEILEGLKYPESAGVLNEWILQKLSSDEANECVLFLEILVKFTTFLDSKAYLQIYGQGGDEIPLLPFQAMHKGVREATQHLRNAGVEGGIVTELEDIEQLIFLRFRQIFKGTIKESEKADVSIALKPSTDDLALAFLDHSAGRGKDNTLPYSESARMAVTLLEQSGMGADDILRFCDQVSVLDLALAEEVHKRAIACNLIKDTTGEYTRQIYSDTLSRLSQSPWKGKEANSTNFANVIRGDTDIFRIVALTGSVAPATAGHLHLTQSALNFIKFNEKKDREKGTRSQHIVLWMPITTIEDLSAPHKDPQELGTTNERVASLLLELTDLSAEDRRYVFVTTSLQPRPNQVGSTVKRINVTLNNVANKIHNDLKRAGRLLDQEIVTTLGVGSDELNWENGPKGRDLPPNQSGKFSPKSIYDSLVVTRQGFTVDLLRNWKNLKAYTNTRAVVLTPGSQRPGSTETRRLIRLNDYSMLPVSMIPYVQEHWKTIPTRDWPNRQTREDPVPPVSQIALELENEYRGLISARK